MRQLWYSTMYVSLRFRWKIPTIFSDTRANVVQDVQFLHTWPRRNVIQFLRATGAAQLYAGAMSPPAAEQIISALQLIQDADGSGRGPRKLSQLRENSNYFREKLQDIGLNVLGDADSPVMVRRSCLVVVWASFQFTLYVQ